MEMRRRGFLGAMLGAAIAAAIDPTKAVAEVVNVVHTANASQAPVVIGTIVNDQWYHIAITHVKGTVKVYLNGKMVDDIDRASINTENGVVCLKVDNRDVIRFNTDPNQPVKQPKTLTTSRGETIHISGDRLNFQKDYTVETWVYIPSEKEDKPQGLYLDDVRVTSVARPVENMGWFETAKKSIHTALKL